MHDRGRVIAAMYWEDRAEAPGDARIIGNEPGRHGDDVFGVPELITERLKENPVLTRSERPDRRSDD
jgi:hypothetical protein